MKPKLVSFLCVLIGLGFLGCATSPVATDKATEVPSSRIISTAFLTNGADRGQVVIKRDAGFSGSACTSRVYVNGSAIADLQIAEKLTVYLPVGEHIIGAEPNGICTGGLTEVSIRVQKDKPTVLRIGYGGNSDYRIQPTAF